MRDPAATARRLRPLKELACGSRIDDFGTGYGSMAYLRPFPVDALKIDRASSIAASKESAALVHTLVQLGKTLDLETLGEGIEQHAQMRSLQEEECDFGQGFLFARPLPPADVECFLDSATTTAGPDTSAWPSSPVAVTAQARGPGGGAVTRHRRFSTAAQR
jgi:EAL domain-containing protein (putative c-di-GMP-specific phosphodiesterase class I)